MTPLTTDVTPKGKIDKTSKFFAQMRPAEAFQNWLVYYIYGILLFLETIFVDNLKITDGICYVITG